MTFYCSGYPELYVKGAIIILGDTTINASELVPALTDLSSQCGTQLYRSVALMKLKEGTVECEEYCRLKYVSNLIRTRLSFETKMNTLAAKFFGHNKKSVGFKERRKNIGSF